MLHAGAKSAHSVHATGQRFPDLQASGEAKLAPAKLREDSLPSQIRLQVGQTEAVFIHVGCWLDGLCADLLCLCRNWLQRPGSADEPLNSPVLILPVVCED